ncbi:hypothetical protein GPECTOR_24g174 [Gonium pectorale]|uniref:ADP,ATP carrier protein n=1 Tax=Gonium pectorale TaxID=33097 RepID=A0A150GGY0_GONPE|nr:hypothetical protein GPECTOR_24g174 [Gonium pectorale]|eukprot:KXZ48885.1 hypothetical protein GPECTOR_24g174 [Gonium pectorale]
MQGGLGDLSGRPFPPKPVEKKVAAPAPQAAASDAPAPEPKKFLGFEPLTWAKILPLGAMFFSILFNYTILRDTKDVLVVTAPGSGAEIIPFLKTWVNLTKPIMPIPVSLITSNFAIEQADLTLVAGLNRALEEGVADRWSAAVLRFLADAGVKTPEGLSANVM